MYCLPGRGGWQDFDADLRRMGVVIKLLPLDVTSTRVGPSYLIVSDGSVGWAERLGWTCVVMWWKA